MTVSDAAIADYFCKGLETALLPQEQVRAWADGVIARLDEPPYAFIAVSMSRGMPALIAALREFPPDQNQSQVGHWLLAHLQQADVDSTSDLAAAIHKALLVCRHCGLDEEIGYEFDRIGDCLDLALEGQYGTVDACRSDFLACLQRYAQPFPELPA